MSRRSLAGLLPGTVTGRATLAVLLVVFLAMRLAEACGRAPGWASAHVDDLLVMPLVLTAVLAAHRLAGRPADWVLPLTHSLPVLVTYSVFFEVLLPRWDARATADGQDVLAYVAGWLAHRVLLNVPGSPCGHGASGRS